MRCVKPTATSRREHLSNALGTALVTASTWPIRAEARSAQDNPAAVLPNLDVQLKRYR